MNDDVHEGERDGRSAVPAAAPRGERRRHERVQTRGTPASLLWIAHATGAALHGEVVDIGLGGAAFRGEGFPPPGRPVWLRLVAAAWRQEALQVVESRLAGASDAPDGATVVHLEFVSPCPDGFLGSATGRR